jgi:hypothetical protein
MSPCWQLYAWATAAVASYSFKLGDDLFEAMVPVWDALNHVTDKVNVRLHHDAARGVLQVRWGRGGGWYGAAAGDDRPTCSMNWGVGLQVGAIVVVVMVVLRSAAGSCEWWQCLLPALCVAVGSVAV